MLRIKKIQQTISDLQHVDSLLGLSSDEIKSAIDTILTKRFNLSAHTLIVARRVATREDDFVGQDLRLLRASIANRIYTLRRELAQLLKAERRA